MLNEIMLNYSVIISYKIYFSYSDVSNFEGRRLDDSSACYIATCILLAIFAKKTWFFLEQH